MPGLFAELKRRNVIRVGVVYAVVAWAVVQAADLFAPVLGLPDWAVSFALYVAVIGFPFALVCAWAVELGPAGTWQSGDAQPGETTAIDLGWRLGWLVIALLCFAVLFLLAERRANDHSGAPKIIPTAGPRSIAVLPFVNMSSDPSQEYFSDGIAAELLAELSRVDNLKVAARTSTFFFKGKDVDIRTIGEQLHVETVL